MDVPRGAFIICFSFPHGRGPGDGSRGFSLVASRTASLVTTDVGRHSVLPRFGARREDSKRDSHECDTKRTGEGGTHRESREKPRPFGRGGIANSPIQRAVARVVSIGYIPCREDVQTGLQISVLPDT